MTYADRVEVDAHGNVTTITVDDVWILANKPNTLLLSIDKTQITANDTGSDVATITVQLRTPILIDDSYDNVVESGDVEIIIEDVPIAVSLVKGVGTQELGSVFAKTYTVRGYSHDSTNELTIEAV